MITHLAFYSGWPTASTALTIAREILGERQDKQDLPKEQQNADA